MSRDVGRNVAPDEPFRIGCDGTRPIAFAASLAYLRSAHWPARACERTDHATEIAAAAQREAEASADDIVAVIDAVLDGLALSPDARERGAAIAVAALERLADPTRLPDRGRLPTAPSLPKVSRW